ncbi:MAG: right-handed parallel beta-helix repeat-containing protein [Candidatus Bathyarchaeota archaeon]|nr:right-handed parallel beta-helix repeat-containing protein [Candidatus Bathyarchaeum sp.]
MPVIKKSVTREFLIAFLVTALVLAITLNFGAVPISAQSGLVVVIGSDTTWTKADSPYNLTGPLLVNAGVTLTVESGVTVDLNGYHIRVDGALCAKGNDVETVRFVNCDEIDFTSSSIPWSEQDGSGCILEHVVLEDVTLSSNGSLKISNSNIIGEITVGASSIIVKSTIKGRHFSSTSSLPYAISAGDSSVISDNTITGTDAQGQAYALYYDLCYAISVSGSCVISNNTIVGDVIGESSTISSNTITGTVKCSFAVISDNTLTGKISGVSCTIANNTIAGGEPTYDWGGRANDSSSAISIRGDSSVISNNIISSPLGGYGITLTEGYTHIFGNVIFDSIYGIRAAGGSTIEGNLITNNGKGIAIGHITFSGFNEYDYGAGNVVIRNNTISNNTVGIGGGDGGSAVIENNLITNSLTGISASLPVTIQRNTISNTTVAINLGNCSSITLSYNNIKNYAENSIYLTDTPNDISAANNWWGTTDTQAINLTIHDSKYDFDLGTVSFTPFLTEPNSEAMPTSSPEFPSNFVIPEFPAWVILPLFLVVSLVAVFWSRMFGVRLQRS